MYPGNELIALTVAFALLATVVVAKTIGGILPIIAKAVKADPAIMAAPLITTIVDACSLVIYFNVAERLLKLWKPEWGKKERKKSEKVNGLVGEPPGRSMRGV